ncbi:MAG: hypothetical protein LBT47_12950 [Deltaproteobacteria bacterium]|nr:hypothetical protein [Deltaproteobacteria bacterium]
MVDSDVGNLDVLGGAAFGNNVTNNSVTITTGGVVGTAGTGSVFGGVSQSVMTVSGNSVTMNDGLVNEQIVGGGLGGVGGGLANNNTVTITGGNVVDSVYGAAISGTATATAYDNHIFIGVDGGTGSISIGNFVVGGSTAGGTAKFNDVQVYYGAVANAIIGGQVDGGSGASVTDNEVLVKGSTITVVTFIAGGYIPNLVTGASFYRNIVTVNDDIAVANVYGAFIADTNLTGNINDSTVNVTALQQLAVFMAAEV